MEINAMCLVSVDDTMTAGGKSTDPSLVNPEASPAAEAMENSPAEKPAKGKKNSLCAFFRKTWLAVKTANQCRRRGNKVAPLQPVSDMDVADPQCGPSGLEPTAPSLVADPQPGPSSLEPTSVQDHAEPQPGPSSVTPTNCDENLADPEPAEENQTNKKKKKKKHIRGFFRRTWRAVKRAATQCKKHNKVAPLCPQPNTDPGDPLPDPNVLESTALQDLADPLPGLSVLEPQLDQFVFESTVVQDLADEMADVYVFESQLDKSILESTVLQDSADPMPDLFVLEPQLDQFISKSMAMQDPANPQPDPIVLEPTALQDSADLSEDLQPGSSDPKRDPDASKMTPVEGRSGILPVGLQDPAVPQAGPTVLNSSALQDLTDRPEDPQPDSSDCDQDSDEADSLPGPSGLEPAAPKYPAASKHRRIRDGTSFRAACFTDPTPVPFDEIYEVGEEIGEGGFGTVYEGISKLLQEQVAIKVIPKCDADRYIEIPGCSKPLFVEVAMNLLLKRPPLSPYIVHMLEWFEEEDRFILILEYPQPCKDLLKFMVNNMQRVNEAQIRSLMYQAVLGAKHCLDRGVFHRDIKLNNFLVNTNTNQVKLIDFGCGDLVKPSGYLGGFTGGVCPPEYYKDLKYEAGPTTVWSLGIMMYTMVCRCQPFNHVEDIMHGSLSFNVRVSTELQDLISRCLTYHPTERATIDEILEHEWFQQGQMSGVTQDQVVTADAPNRPL
ncbi:serine threonine- kinase pim-2-like protein [Labeo rohita]|uniref:non-specific serine/threonine protein kinase n=1 Tax=Labeo rohita TaxID=84645 RepID=A0A498N9C1_LABRO|nr:serine threonine- kinase pim-2-like protein [Labeo rohita]